MLRKLFVVFLLLATVSAVAATTDANSQPATSVPAIKTYLMPDLTFVSVFSFDSKQPSEGLAAQPDTLARPRTGFCRCSCGFPCATSADCGGSSCDKFITCCVGKPKNPEADWFTRSLELSSHKTSQPDVILEQIAKGECK